MTEKETFHYTYKLIETLKAISEEDGASWDLVRQFLLILLSRKIETEE